MNTGQFNGKPINSAAATQPTPGAKPNRPLKWVPPRPRRARTKK